METRANHALIGLFTLSVMAAAFGFVYWFKAVNNAGARQSYRVVFQGSVSGLSRGSSVRFNGLTVGEVTSIALVPDDPRLVAAIIEIDPTTPVKADTRARLEYQGLTGVATIQLAGGDKASPPLAAPDSTARATIFADRSDFQDIMETAQRIAGRVDSAVTKIEKLIGENEASISATVKNVETFSNALASNSAGVSAFLSAVGDTSQRISALSGKLDKLAVDLDDVVKGIDPQTISRILGNADAVAQTFADNRQSVSTIITDTGSLMRRLNDTSVKLDTALIEFNRVAGALDSNKVSSVMENAEKFSRVLGDKSQDVDKMLANAREISDKLNKSADKVDRVLAAAENFLGTNGGGNNTQGMFAEITEAAKAFRQLSVNLDKRVGEISGGVNRLSGSGKRDLEAISSDIRNSANQLNRTARSLERDPSQLIFGGQSSMPLYNGTR